MSFYFAKSPFWFRWVYPNLLWRVKTVEKRLFLTFDDGPHPEATHFVLDTLREYNAKATFFCVGKNVEMYPEIYERIIAEGHAAGNHTHSHLNGWKVEDDFYYENIRHAAHFIKSRLFRPPYGRITRQQSKHILENNLAKQIVMWDVLSGDFDVHISPEKCYKNVMDNIRSGSIVVFHDSAKAFPVLKIVLPQIISELKGEGWSFAGLQTGIGKI